MHVHRTLEMSITREEFLRLLPAAVGPFEVNGNTIMGHGTACGWLIRLTPLTDHRAGSIVVPRHRVELVLEGCAESEAEAFMERFHRAFLRGGG
jgi:hypothetical protein